jgi:hypothetical protein
MKDVPSALCYVPNYVFLYTIHNVVYSAYYVPCALLHPTVRQRSLTNAAQKWPWPLCIFRCIRHLLPHSQRLRPRAMDAEHICIGYILPHQQHVKQAHQRSTAVVQGHTCTTPWPPARRCMELSSINRPRKGLFDIAMLSRAFSRRPETSGAETVETWGSIVSQSVV